MNSYGEKGLLYNGPSNASKDIKMMINYIMN